MSAVKTTLETVRLTMAIEADYSKATFHRHKQKLEAAGLVRLNPEDKKWSQSQPQSHENETETTAVCANQAGDTASADA